MLGKIKLAFGFNLKIRIEMLVCCVGKPKLMVDNGNNETAACVQMHCSSHSEMLIKCYQCWEITEIISVLLSGAQYEKTWNSDATAEVRGFPCRLFT